MRYGQLYLLIFTFLAGCTKPLERPEIHRISFLSNVRYDADYSNGELRQGKYYIFSFHQFYYSSNTDTTEYTRSLYVHFPASDTSFAFGNDSTHLFQHIVTNTKGLLQAGNIEEISNALINGRLLPDGRWKVTAKTKYFDFSKIVVIMPYSFEEESFRL